MQLLPCLHGVYVATCIPIIGAAVGVVLKKRKRGEEDGLRLFFYTAENKLEEDDIILLQINLT